MNRKYTKEILEEAVRNATSVMGVIRYLGKKQTGGTQAHLSRLIKSFGIDTSHFLRRGPSLRKPSNKKKPKEDILVKRESGGRQKPVFLVRAMIESGVAHSCQQCGCPPFWRDNKLTLDVDHINQDWLDDRLENLRFLCPNCHSQFSRNLLRKQ